jgi:hypothetical protein
LKQPRNWISCVLDIYPKGLDISNSQIRVGRFSDWKRWKDN